MRGARIGFAPSARNTRARIRFTGGGAGAMRPPDLRTAISFTGGGSGALATYQAAVFTGGGAGALQQRALIQFTGGGAGFLSIDEAEPTWPNGYSHFIEFLIPQESVRGGGTLNNCLICLDETLPDLRAVANGGHVVHASGYDMRLELADGTAVPFARVVWGDSTGRFVARARLASLTVADTRLRLFFGRTVASDGANSGAAYAAHLAAPDIVTGADRTGLSRTWTPTGLTSGTLAGYAATFNGTTAQLLRANPTELNGLGAITVQALVQLSSVAADVPILMVGPTTGTDLGLMLYFHAATGRLIFRLTTSGGTTEVQSADGVTPAVGVPILAAARWASGSAPSLYVGGQIVTPAVPGAALTGTTNTTLGAASSEALVGYNRVANVRLAGQIADLMVSARSLSEGHLQTQERNYLTPRDSYGIGERNAADTVNLSPVVPPIFATAVVGTVSEVDVAAETYEADVGQVKTLETLTGTGGGTASIVGGRARFLGSAVGDWRRTATVKDDGSPAKRSAAPIIWMTSAAPIVTPDRPKTPSAVAASRQWWIGGGGPSGSQSPASWAAAYGAVAASGGDHIYLPAGSVALGTLSRNFPAANPLVIRGRPMAAGSKAPTSIISGKTTVSGSGYWLYEVQTNWASSTRGNPDILVTGSYVTITRCWLTGREAMHVSAPGHHVWTGWNRFTGRNSPTGTDGSGNPTTLNCFQYKINVPGNFPTQTSGPYDIYCYRNFFWDDVNHRLYSNNDGGESMCCYVGNDHPGPADLGTLLNIVFEENYLPAAGGNSRPRSIYSKRGCSMIRNRSTHAYGVFGQRHGWGSKIYGNRVTDPDFVVIGDERAGGYANGNDIRNNVAGGAIKLYRASHLQSGAPYQAADWTTLFANQGNVTVGFKPGNAIADTIDGGTVSNVRIYQHTPAPFVDPTHADAATITVNAGNPLGLTNGADLIPATWADVNVGFEVTGQGL